jgi:hypothetical protein
MSLQSWREVDATREKLRLLEDRCRIIAARPCHNEHIRELSLRSFKAIINQMKEEIAIFESHASSAPTCKQ